MFNVALGKPADQSSTSEWSRFRDTRQDARTANNGDVTDPAFFHTGADLAPWWQVDLCDVYLIRRIEIFTRTDLAQVLDDLECLTSLDGNSWVPRSLDVLLRPEQSRDPTEGNVSGQIAGDVVARFVRLYRRSYGYLYFRECRVLGDVPDPAHLSQHLGEAMIAQVQRLKPPAGRTGYVTTNWPFLIFVDIAAYSHDIIAALDQGYYEQGERELVRHLLSPGDRVIEVGTAAGLVAMTVAFIVGAGNLSTFEANPEIARDAQANFDRNGLGAIRLQAGILKNRRRIEQSGSADVPFHVHSSFWASRLQASRDDYGIVKTIDVPVFCLEDQIIAHGARVLICDIEGAEADLISDADLSAITMIIMEVHYAMAGEQAINAMIRKLILDGFALDLNWCQRSLLVLRREKPQPIS